MSGPKAKVKANVAASCPFYCLDVWMPGALTQRVSALPLYANAHTHTTTHVHTHTKHTHACLSILTTALWMPNPPASLRDCLLGLKGLGCSKQGQSMCTFMSFELFHVISQHASARRSCLCEACVLSDQVKISCYFQMLLFKRLLWCIKSDLKCACRCLWFSPKAPMARHAL